MRHQWTISIDYELHNKFKRLSDITRIPRSRLFDEALEDLLIKHDFKKLEEEAKKKGKYILLKN